MLVTKILWQLIKGSLIGAFVYGMYTGSGQGNLIMFIAFILAVVLWVARNIMTLIIDTSIQYGIYNEIDILLPIKDGKILLDPESILEVLRDGQGILVEEDEPKN